MAATGALSMVCIEVQIGPTLTMIWAIMLTAGGVLGAWSTLTKWWVSERAAILLAGHGAAIYGVTVFYNHIVSDGNRISQLMFIVFAIIALGVRFWDIRRLNRKPG